MLTYFSCRCSSQQRPSLGDHKILFSLVSVGNVQATPPENRTTFKQRYFLCDEHWKSHMDGTRGPIFFYVGNEADVTLYGPTNSHHADPAAPPFMLFILVIHRMTHVKLMMVPCRL